MKVASIKTDAFCLPTEDLQLKENEIIDIPTRNNERLKIKDEWDIETICHQIKECHPCLIKAKLAGSGKSYMGEYMKNLNHNVLFVCPNNKQIQEVGVDAIRNNLGKKCKYEVGEFLIAREYKNEKEHTFNVNFKYEILNVNLKTAELENVKTKEKVITTVDILDKHFIYAYCATCHSSQGASVDISITIFEWEKNKLITREWFYTALTRSTDINKVKFYRSFDEVDELNEGTMRRYLQRKVNQYKLQDLKAGRTIDETKYITADWLMDRINSRCNKCSCNFTFDYLMEQSIAISLHKG